MLGVLTKLGPVYVPVPVSPPVMFPPVVVVVPPVTVAVEPPVEEPEPTLSRTIFLGAAHCKAFSN